MPRAPKKRLSSPARISPIPARQIPIASSSTAPHASTSAAPASPTSGEEGGGDDEYIPRPPNSWIIFRAEKLKEMQARYAGRLIQSDASKTIKVQWDTLTREERAYWDRRAELAKEEHRIKYPNYRYKPMKKEEKLRLKEEKARLQREKQQAKLAEAKSGKKPRQPSQPIPAGTLPFPIPVPVAAPVASPLSLPVAVPNSTVLHAPIPHSLPQFIPYQSLPITFSNMAFHPVGPSPAMSDFDGLEDGLASTSDSPYPATPPQMPASYPTKQDEESADSHNAPGTHFAVDQDATGSQAWDFNTVPLMSNAYIYEGAEGFVDDASTFGVPHPDYNQTQQWLANSETNGISQQFGDEYLAFELNTFSGFGELDVNLGPEVVFDTNNYLDLPNYDPQFQAPFPQSLSVTLDDFDPALFPADAHIPFPNVGDTFINMMSLQQQPDDSLEAPQTYVPPGGAANSGARRVGGSYKDFPRHFFSDED